MIGKAAVAGGIHDAVVSIAPYEHHRVAVGVAGLAHQTVGGGNIKHLVGVHVIGVIAADGRRVGDVDRHGGGVAVIYPVGNLEGEGIVPRETGVGDIVKAAELVGVEGAVRGIGVGGKGQRAAIAA